MAIEPVRSFIAIELPQGLKQALGELMGRLQETEPWPVKWIAPEAVHLTLKFLGNIAPGRVGEIIKAVEMAAAGVPPFRLRFGGLGVFPNIRRCQVAWAGLEGDLDALDSLQQSIENQLSRLGFARENRAFTPHLTVARVRDRALSEERQRLGESYVQDIGRGLGDLAAADGTTCVNQLYERVVRLLGMVRIHAQHEV